MVGTLQPLAKQFAIVDDNGNPTDYFIRWAQERQIDISDGISAAEAQTLIDTWAAARTVTAGTALGGGGNLSTDITINHDDSTVTPGTYGDATNVPQLTVDAQGHITAVTDVAITGGGGGSGVAYYSDTGAGQTGITSTSYATLTNTPTVTATTGTEVLVVISCRNFTNTHGSGYNLWLAVEVSGATTLAASDTYSFTGSGTGTYFAITGARAFKLSGLTAGSNTFTVAAKVNGSNWNADTVDLTIIPLSGGGGGSGNDYFNGGNWTVPASTDFTADAASGVSAYSIDDAATGVSLTATTSSYCHMAADIAVTGTTADVTLTGIIYLASPNNGNWGMGIHLKDDAGKRLQFGFRNTVMWRNYFSTVNDTGSNANITGSLEIMLKPIAYRLRKSSGTMYFEIAMDGKNFDVMYSESATAYLTNTIAGYGISVSPNAATMRLGCAALELV